MLPILGGLFASGAFNNPQDKIKMISSYATKAINSLDPAGLGQTNAILGVYGKGKINAGADMPDVNADISATNLARDKQTEDDARKKQYDEVINAALTRRDKTSPILNDILSGISAIGRR